MPLHPSALRLLQPLRTLKTHYLHPPLLRFRTFRKNHPILTREFRRFCLFASWIPALICFIDYVGELAPVDGASMYPYLNEGFDRSLERDICWVNKFGGFSAGDSAEGAVRKKETPRGKGWGRDGKEYAGLKRGMIVSLLSPTNPEIYSVKRVIALPGDTVLTHAPYPEPKVEIPAGHIWVEGDGWKHGKQSLDSNYYGPVAVNLVQGRLTFVVWPWRNWGPIRWWEFKGRGGVVEGKLVNDESTGFSG